MTCLASTKRLRGILLRQADERQKPTEVGEATKEANRDKILVTKGRLSIAGYPHRGEGCGDTLNDGILMKKGSNFG